MNQTKNFNVSHKLLVESNKQIKELEKIKIETQKTFNHTYNEYMKIKYSYYANEKKSLTLTF